MTLDTPTCELIRTLVAAAAEAGGRKVMPAGRRQEVVELLTRLVAVPELYEEFGGTVAAERERQGRERTILLLITREDIPWEQIRPHGFADLPDAVLADLATSPEAMSALEEVEFAGDGREIGMRFFEAVWRESVKRPDAAERAERNTQVVREAIRRFAE